MTTIITRLYSDNATAQAVVLALKAIGLDDDEVALIAPGDAGDAAARMRAMRVDAETVATGVAGLAKGQSAVIVAAPFNPVGIARKATAILDAHHPVAADERYIVEDYRTSAPSNLYPAGTYFMSIPPEYSGGPSHGHVLSLGGLVSRPRERRSAMTGGGFMSRKLLPFPLLMRKSDKLSVIRDGGWQLSRMLGIPTIAGR